MLAQEASSESIPNVTALIREDPDADVVRIGPPAFALPHLEALKMLIASWCFGLATIIRYDEGLYQFNIVVPNLPNRNI